MKRTCTWLIEAKKKGDEVVPEHECGNTAVVRFSRKDAGSNRKMPRLNHYPRCKKHAPPAAYQEAISAGYDVKELS